MIATELQHTEKPGASSSDAVVSLRNIKKFYNDFVAVEDFTLDVTRGELLCLLGPSGCGKTTTLRMVAGFVEPSGGEVYIEGQSVTNLPPYKRDTGMVFQAYALFPHMTVAENVAFGLENLKVGKAEREESVSEVLALVELDHLKHRYPKELSGGQQQRVALARALALRPAVLLLDEPFSNLDAQLRVRLRDELRSLIDRVKITTIFVTHDQEEALMLSDRIAVMNRGRVEQVGTPEEIYERPKSRFVAEFIGWCSIIEGTVASGQFNAPSGFILPVEAPDGAAHLVLRPEYISLQDSAGPGTIAGEILSCNYFGSLTRMRVQIQGETLLVERHFVPGSRPKVGDVVALSIDPAGIRLVPPPTS